MDDRPTANGNAMALLLAAALLGEPDRTRANAIPGGHECTACGKTYMHDPNCKPPRGLREVKR